MKPHTDDSDARRTRAHARALAGRICAAGGQVVLVRGRPDPARLLERVAGWVTLPATAPPAELGFASSDIILMTRGSLSTRSRSVQKWRTAVEREAAARPSAARRRELAEQTAELDPLSDRVADLHRLLADPVAVNQPFWLTPVEESELAAATRELVADRVVTADVAWLARLVRWVGGLPVCRRFLTTVRDALCFPAEHAERDAILRFREIVLPVVGWLDIVNGMPEGQQATGLAECREKSRRANVVARLRRAFEELPDSACGPNRIVLPTRKSEIDPYLLRDRCEVVLKDYPPPPEWATLARLAALYLTDGGAAVLPWSCATKLLTAAEEVVELREQSGKPGYELLLWHIGEVTFDRPTYDNVRRLLVSGAGIDDVNWWGEELQERLADYADPPALRPVRAVVQWLQRHDAVLDTEDAIAFWQASAASGRVVAESLSRFVGWLAKPTAQQVAEVAGLVRLLSVPALRHRLVELLRRWSDPPPRTRLPDDCPTGLPADLVALLRRLAFYQRMAGEDVRLPKSLRKPLEATARAEREVTHLRGLGDRLDAKQAARLRHLTARAATASAGDEAAEAGRLVRQAREVAALTALAAAKVAIRADLTDWWRAKFDTDPDLDSFRWQHLHHLMVWADGLSASDRRQVDAIAVALRDHGERYREYLPQNAAWLDRALKAGLDRDAWFRPPPARVTLPDGRRLALAVATDPRDIYLMGTRFGSCLSLDDGCNRNAVIPNAADANKAVLYARTPDGEPFARRLVGVTAGGRLVGYRVYANSHPDGLTAEMDAYCGAWAARAGLTLGDSGVPENLTGGFWYDDGPHAWSAEARAAFDALRPADPTARQHSAESLLRAAVAGDDPAAFDALLTADLPDGWRTTVAYWHLVRFPARPWTHWDGVNRLELLRHLLAAGQLDGRRNPATWGMTDGERREFQFQATRCYFTLVPPAAAAQCDAAEVMRRMLAGTDPHDDATFNAAPPGHGVALLPFAVAVGLLRQYARWLPELGHWVGHDSRGDWADRLWRAWRRDPDPTAAVAALADPDERVREVMRLFCRLEYVPELLRRLRHEWKAAAASAEADAPADVLAVWDLPQDRARLAGRPRPATPERSPPWDPARPVAERLAAAERDADSPAAASRWYFLLDPDERADLPPAVRVRFAVALIDGDGWSEGGWPLLGWLATVPDADRVSVWFGGEERGGAAGARLLAGLGDGYLRPLELILMHALDHPDGNIRAAARSGYLAAARLDTTLCDRLLNRAAPFVCPPTFDELVVACRAAGESASEG